VTSLNAEELHRRQRIETKKPKKETVGGNDLSLSKRGRASWKSEGGRSVRAAQLAIGGEKRGIAEEGPSPSSSLGKEEGGD